MWESNDFISVTNVPSNLEYKYIKVMNVNFNKITYFNYFRKMFNGKVERIEA